MTRKSRILYRHFLRPIVSRRASGAAALSFRGSKHLPRRCIPKCSMFAVVFSSCVSGEGALVKLRNSVPHAGILLVSGDVSAAMSGYTIDAAGVLTV